MARKKKKWEMDRRHFLKSSVNGVSAVLGLPFLEAMMPNLARAGYNGTDAPVRSVFMYCAGEGPRDVWPEVGQLTPASVQGTTLEPLSNHLDYITLALNANHHCDPAAGQYGHNVARYVNQDGLVENSNTTPNGDPSIHSVIADHHASNGYIGIRRVLALAGYEYRNSIVATDSNGVAIPHMLDPVTVYNVLIGGGSSNQTAFRLANRLSVLDLVMDQLSAFRGRLGSTDLQRLDQYTTSIRETEIRLTEQSLTQQCAIPGAPDPAIYMPDSNQRHIAQGREKANALAMMDMIVLALQCDLTRVVSFSFMNGWNHNYTEIIDNNGVNHGTNYSFHGLTHRTVDPNDPGIPNSVEEMEAAIRGIYKINYEVIDYLLTRLKQINEGNGSNLLHNCFVEHGFEHWRGHAHYGIPILMAGHAGGAINPGHAIDLNMYSDRQRRGLPNFWLTALRAAGSNATNFAHNTHYFNGLTRQMEAI